MSPLARSAHPACRARRRTGWRAAPRGRGARVDRAGPGFETRNVAVGQIGPLGLQGPAQDRLAVRLEPETVEKAVAVETTPQVVRMVADPGKGREDDGTAQERPEGRLRKGGG